MDGRVKIAGDTIFVGILFLAFKIAGDTSGLSGSAVLSLREKE